MTVTENAAPAAGPRPPGRAVVARVTTALAAALVFAALVAPGEPAALGVPSAYVRIPAEALLGVALLVVLPWRAGRVVAAAAGVVLGLLTLLRLLDAGFTATLARPFDPLGDWGYLKAAAGFLEGAVGHAATVGAAVALAVLVAAVLVVMPLAVLRVSRPLRRNRPVAVRLTAVLAVLWLGCAALGAQIVPGEPVASRDVAAHAVHRVLDVGARLADERAFATALASDPYADVPADQLLTALRGKDVVFTFVESYGRVALEDPEVAPGVGAVLDEGTRRLAAAGYASQSAFLTSPIAGGGSWLAHATLLSGLRIGDQHRHDALEASNRLTLTSAFRAADWRTVGIMPGVTEPWPEAEFYGYDHVYDAAHLGYAGPNFSWSTMPDQYTLQAFENLEHRGRHPVMAEIPLVSSHSPWSPVPQLVDWHAVGDGTVFGPMAVGGGAPADILTRDPARVRADYRASIEYSLRSLVSYVETYGDDDLVLVFLGDHQPAPVVTGDGAGRDVPITVVTRDRAVHDRIAAWAWHPGLNPAPDAPVWPMESFRDRFLDAFAA